MKNLMKISLLFLGLSLFFISQAPQKALAGDCSYTEYAYHNGRYYNHSHTRLGFMNNSGDGIGSGNALPESIDSYYAPTDPTAVFNQFDDSGWSRTSDAPYFDGKVQNAESYTDDPYPSTDPNYWWWYPEYIDGVGYRFRTDSTGNKYKYRGGVHIDYYKTYDLPDSTGPNMWGDATTWTNTDAPYLLVHENDDTCNRTLYIRGRWALNDPNVNDTSAGATGWDGWFQTSGSYRATWDAGMWLKRSVSNPSSGIWFLYAQGEDDVYNANAIRLPLFYDVTMPNVDKITVSNYEYKQDDNNYWVKSGDSFDVTQRVYDQHSNISSQYIRFVDWGYTGETRIFHSWDVDRNHWAWNDVFVNSLPLTSNSLEPVENKDGYGALDYNVTISSNNHAYDLQSYLGDHAGNNYSMPPHNDVWDDSKIFVHTDANNPTVTLKPDSQTTWKEGTNNAVTISASDNESGLDSYKYRISNDNGVTWGDWVTASSSSTPLTLDDGDNQIEVIAKDNVGHTTDVTKEFKVDLTPPVLTLTPDGQVDWSPNDTMTATAKDATTYIDWMGYTFYRGNGIWDDWTVIDKVPKVFKFSEGTSTIKVYARDATGNYISKSRTFRVDYDKPIVTFTPDGQTWDSNSTVTLTAKDDDRTTTDNSGLKTFQYRTKNGSGDWSAWKTYSSPITLPEGVNEVEAKATDNAGNETDITKEFQVDYTQPTINVTGVEDTKVYTNAVTPKFPLSSTVNDSSIYDTGGSGLDTSSETVSLKRTNNGTTTTDTNYTSGTIINKSGDYVLTITIKDNAGNSTTKTIRFTVYMPPTFNMSYDKQLVYYMGSNITFNVTTSSDRNVAQISLYYAIDNTSPDTNTDGKKVGTVSRNSSTGLWNTSGWSPLDLGATTVKGLRDGEHNITFWEKDEKGATTPTVTMLFEADTAPPTNLTLYYLPKATSTVALGSKVKYAVSAKDPVPTGSVYAQKENVQVKFNIYKNSIRVVPDMPIQVKLNGEPTDPYFLNVDTQHGYQTGDTITITPSVDDLRGNSMTGVPTYTIRVVAPTN